VKKMIVAAMLVMGTSVFAADQNTAAAQQPDPLVSVLNQLVDSLSAADAVTPAEGNAAAAKGGKSKKDTAIAVGTAAAIGSAIGAMIAKDDRAKGAAIGAAVGGIAGLIYDRMHAKDEAAKSEPEAQQPATVPANPVGK